MKKYSDNFNINDNDSKNNSNHTLPTVVGSDDQDICTVCYINTAAIEVCNKLHSFCEDCINMHFENQLSVNPEKTVDIVCMQSGCGENMALEKVKFVLAEDMCNYLEKCNVINNLEIPEGLKLINCPFCPKKRPTCWLININDFPDSYKCENCQNNICLYCFGKFSDTNKHKDCKENQQIYKDFDKYCNICYYFSCQDCKTNVKNDEIKCFFTKISNCNDIHCIYCQKSTCYICKGFNLSDHHKTWKTNNLCCPQYLSELKNLKGFETWPDDINDSIKIHDKFNEYRSKAILKRIIGKYGQQKVLKAFETCQNNNLILTKENLSENFSNFKNIPYLDDRIFRFHTFN